MLLRLSKRENAKQLAEKGLKALAGFVSGLKVSYHDIEVRLDFEPEPGLADSADLENDLRDLFVSVGDAATKLTAVVLHFFLDELQYVKEDELAALVSTFHFVAQRKLPIAMIAAGLPQVRGQLGRAKSYAERMFDFPRVDALSSEDAKIAIERPASQEGVTFESNAIEKRYIQNQVLSIFPSSLGKIFMERSGKLSHHQGSR